MPTTSTTERFLVPWVGVTLLLAFVISGFGLAARFRVEEANKAATLLAEWDAVESLAAVQGVPLPEALQSLRAQGLGGLVLNEESVGELVDEGRLRLSSDPSADRVFLEGLRTDLERVAVACLSFYGSGAQIEGDRLVIRGIGGGNVRSLLLGVDVARAEIVREANLIVVGRLGNPLGAREAYVRNSIQALSAAGGSVLLPLGDQVLGRRDHVDALIESLRQHGVLYASPEFTRLSGDANVLAKAPELVVRLHAAQSAELDRMTLPAVVERYARAGRERNIRLLLVRPVGFSSDAPLTAFGDLLRDITRELIKEGGAVGEAKPFGPPAQTLPSLLFAVPVGLAAGLCLFLLFARWTLPLNLIFGVVISAPLFALESLTGYGALIAALVFPTLGFLLLPKSPSRNLAFLFGLCTLCSLAGGFVVSGALNGLPYLIRADQFTGVKLAHFAPIALVGAVLFLRLGHGLGALKNPITWTQAGLGILILGALLFMLSRTGNDGPAGVSETELRVRALLDTLLYVRPRTKEFLIGHPLMIVGLGMLARLPRGQGSTWGGWTALALALGAIGQTSIVNTLCHFHTPLSIGLARIGVGLVLGGIIGMVLWAILKRYVPVREA